MINECFICALQGRGIGIVIGCIFGMFPLLFYQEPESDKLEPTDE